MKITQFLSYLLFLVSVDIIAQVDQQSVTISGLGYTAKTFAVDEFLWSNRTYTIKAVQDLVTDPSGVIFFPFSPQFNGFMFAQNGASIEEGGTIVPSADGFVYGIAKESEGPSKLGAEWTVVPNSEFTYYHPTLFSYTKLVVFKHAAVANTPIDLPLASGFTGITPIAKSINVKLPVVKSIKIDGVNLASFLEGTLTYPYKLPYTSTAVPVVGVEMYAINANYTITQATNITGTEAERTAAIVVTAADTSVTTYKVIFEVVPELDLFLCIGQSNMSGRDAMNASLGDFIPVDNAFLYTTSGFVNAVNPFNGYSNIDTVTAIGQGVSPSYSFSKKVTATVPNKKIGLIVNARGGSDLIEWDDKADNLYQQTMLRALEAQKWGTYKAVLWHQGEADVSAGDVAAYPNQLTNLVANLREDLGNPNLYFVAGQIGQFNVAHTSFNSVITTIPTFISNTACVLSGGLTDIGDNLHFNRASQIVLGERYADMILNRVYGILGTDEFNNPENSVIKFYDQKLHIDIEESFDIFIFDTSGRELYSKMNETNKVIDLKNFQKMIYIVKIFSNKKYSTLKIIIN
jgi:hypothetical protein